MYKQYEIAILSWNKEHVKVIKKSDYYMITNRIFFDPRVDRSSFLAKFLYFYILTRCAVFNKPFVILSSSHLKAVIKKTYKIVDSCLLELEENKLINFTVI